MDLSTAYRYNQNMMEYYTCKRKFHLKKKIIFKEDTHKRTLKASASLN